MADVQLTHKVFTELQAKEFLSVNQNTGITYDLRAGKPVDVYGGFGLHSTDTPTTSYDATTSGNAIAVIKAEQAAIEALVEASKTTAVNQNIELNTGTASYTANVGDELTLTGTVNEYYSLTQLIDAASYSVNSSGNSTDPLNITTGDLTGCMESGEEVESMLVRVNNVIVTTPSNEFGEWYVDDGTGPVIDSLCSCIFQNGLIPTPGKCWCVINGVDYNGKRLGARSISPPISRPSVVLQFDRDRGRAVANRGNESCGRDRRDCCVGRRPGHRCTRYGRTTRVLHGRAQRYGVTHRR